MSSNIGKKFDILFDSQGVSAAVASPAFWSNYNMEKEPTLRMYGDLDGGTLKLQTLHPAKTINNADNSALSTDWQNTDDVIVIPSYHSATPSNTPYRLLAENAGASADFSAEIIYNI